MLIDTLSIAQMPLCFSVTIFINYCEQLVPGEGLGNIVVRTDNPASCAVEQTILAGQHHNRRMPEHLVMLEQCTRLIAIQPWHHYIQENQVWLVIGNHTEGLKAIRCRDNLIPFLLQQGLGSAANGLAVINDHNLELLTPAPDTPVRHRNIPGTRLYPYVSHDIFGTLLTRL
jgi:hypothetical protein